MEGTVGKPGAAIEGDDVAEDDFVGDEAGLGFELLEDLVHLVEHFCAAEFGDDEIVGEEGVAEGFVVVWVIIRVRV